jgi:hypothetical protein
MDLGPIGDPYTLVWLFCDLQTYGKVLVRQGARPELPKDKPPVWVFCPLQKFPNDRVLVCNCEKCLHYKGASHSTRNAMQPAKEDAPFQVHMMPAQKKELKKAFRKEELETAIREKKSEDERWRREEETIFKKVEGEKNERKRPKQKGS